MQAAEYRHKRQRETDDRRVARQEAIQERAKRDKVVPGKVGIPKGAALKRCQAAKTHVYEMS